MGSDDVAEFVKEREAEGVFRLEVKLTGEVRYLPHRLEATRPLDASVLAGGLHEEKCIWPCIHS
jgi:hypothetical protein